MNSLVFCYCHQFASVLYTSWDLRIKLIMQASTFCLMTNLFITSCFFPLYITLLTWCCNNGLFLSGANIDCCWCFRAACFCPETLHSFLALLNTILFFWSVAAQTSRLACCCSLLRLIALLLKPRDSGYALTLATDMRFSWCCQRGRHRARFPLLNGNNVGEVITLSPCLLCCYVWLL
jgi:hypothetical protein